jgi:Tol biopolymer transport system component
VVAAGLAFAANVLWWPSGRDIDVVATYDGAPAWSPDSRHLVFSAEHSGQTDIWTMTADGTERRSLTSAPGEDGAPAMSPDGARIAFESDRGGNFDIWVMDASGRGPRNLTNHAASDRSPAWSPDGQRIVFLSDRDRRPDADVYVMNADGSNVRRLTTEGKHWAPQVSPDGQLVALQTDQDIRVVNLGTGAARRLTYAPQNGMSPTWSPDGTRLAFTTTRNTRLEIFTMSADGSGQELLVSLAGASALDPRWSPDGTRLAFVSVPTLETKEATTPQPYAIYVVDVDSRRVRRISP